MNSRVVGIASLVLALTAAPGFCQQSLLPPGEKEPLLRLEPDGPSSLVTALTLSPDGKRLYAAGADKVVRLWTLNEKTKQFEFDKLSYRVPIGPGMDGVLNAVALSSDGRWLAVAGRGIVRGSADFRMPGLILPKAGIFTRTMWEDSGIIYVFDTRNNGVRILRGHLGVVRALKFAPSRKDKPALLASVGLEFDLGRNVQQGCMRLWDVDKGGEALAVTADLPAREDRPALEVWHTGAQPSDVRIACAWGDGKLRVWDTAADKTAIVRDGYNGDRDGRFNNSLVYLPGTQQLLSCSLRLPNNATKVSANAQLRLWNVRGATPVEAKVANLDKDYGFEPIALSLVSSRVQGEADLIAVVMRKFTSKEKDTMYLLLVRLNGEQFGEVANWAKLWPTGGWMPVLTTVPGVPTVAVGGNPFHDIRLFNVRDLLADGDKANEKRQVLRGVGKRFLYSAFVRKGKDRGLLLSTEYEPEFGTPPRPPEKGDVIFNLSQRAFTETLTGWNIDRPELAGWKIGHAQPERDERGRAKAGMTVKVTSPAGQAVTIRLPKGEEISDYAVLPALPPLNEPLVALASHALGQPWLRLYSARTGEQVRQYTGHTQPIRSISFSGDGRFLVSTGDDRTLCIWSLAKLEKYYGKRSVLPDTVFRNLILVGAVAADSPAQGQLQAGDVIAGVVRNKRLTRYTTLPGLFGNIAAHPPGTRLTLRVIRDNQPRDLELPVHQGMTERNRALLLGLGMNQPLGLAVLAHGAGQFSPVYGVSLRRTPVAYSVPTGSKLAVGDLVEGVEENKKIRPVESALGLVEALAFRKPGSTVNLNVRGKGNVPVVVGQASDERKPLFFLFIAGGPQVAQWDWIGWSPIGPYEASNRRAERFIGWHFNTGDPRTPASFALIDQYRKEYYRDGILRHLIARGDLGAALKDALELQRVNLPQPKLTLYADEVGPDPARRNGRGQAVVRQQPVAVKLAIDDFPPESIDAVLWQVDDGPLRPFPVGPSPRELGVLIDLKRGEHNVRVVLRTQGAPPQSYTKNLNVRVVPSAPVLLPVVVPAQVQNAALQWQSRVRPGQADQDVFVTLSHRHNDKDVQQPRSWQVPKKGAVAQEFDIADKLTLLPGDNLIELTAANRNAGKDAEDRALETTRRRWLVTLVPPRMVAPPKIALSQIDEGRVDEHNEPVRHSLESGEAVVVRSANVRLEGQIDAGQEVVSEATWLLGKTPRSLDDYRAARKPKMFKFSQKVTLQPGEQTIVLGARAAGSPVTNVAVKLTYRPALPRLLLRGPEEPIYYDTRERAVTAPITGAYLSSRSVPFKAVLLLNEVEVGPVPTDVAEWTQQLALKEPGDNRVQVRLTSAFDMATTEPVIVRYLRPPHDIQFVEAPKQPQQVLQAPTPLLDLTAEVETPLPLIRESVEAEVNGREISSIRLVQGKQGGAWGIVLQNVPLEANQENRVRVWVSNPEARCRVPGELLVKYVPPPEKLPPALPEVDILEPGANANVNDPRVTVRLRIRSDSALRRVEIVQGPDQRLPLTAAELKPNAAGIVEVRKALVLGSGVNRLRVVAVNDGGEQEASVVVNYPRMPVRLNIDEIVPVAAGAGKPVPIRPAFQSEGKLSFAPAPTGEVLVRGHVTWSKEDDEQLRKLSFVRLYVNDFQQVPAELRPPEDDARIRRFSAKLVLNRASQNEIVVELPDLKQDQGNRHQRRFQIACLKPVQGQRLHLLIVGIGVKDASSLLEDARKAVNADKDSSGLWNSRAFSEIRTYGPLSRYVTPEDIYGQLCLIKKNIDMLASTGAGNDVVMVYYRGGESVLPQGNYFATTVSQFNKDTRRASVNFRGLQSYFDDTLGAKLLLLDVSKLATKLESSARPHDEVTQMDAAGAFFSVLRYRWLQSSLEVGAGLLHDWQAELGKQNVELYQTLIGELSKRFQNRDGQMQRSDGVSFDRFIPTGLAELLLDRKTGS